MSDFFPVNQSVASTRWLTEEVFKLIELVQSDEAIYNPRHKYYFCRPYVENFWREVDQKLDKNPGASLAKWTNLRISFRREFTNYLEEQVPPCWSYFDRMFFLHPYLRKKQQQPTRPGDSTLQETLAQISELSNRLERRAVKDSTQSALSTGSPQHNAKDSSQEITNSNSSQQAIPNADHYFDYYDETEPNNSELDEIIDDEQQGEVMARYPQVILETPLAHSKIKSECEDEAQDDEYEQLLETRHEINTGNDRLSDTSIRNLMGSAVTSTRKRTQQQMRLDHLNRLQTRSYHEDLRAKRSRSADRALGNAQTTSLPSAATNHNSRSFCSTTTTLHSSSNVSFVRPTITKVTDASSNTNVSSTAGTDPSTTAQMSSLTTHQPPQHQMRYNPYHATHSQRLDTFSSTNTTATGLNAGSSNPVGGNNTNQQPTRQVGSPSLVASAPTPHLELCDCKTDPDAMFLMSLLPDIQKLNGRDRGKIKIAFQNILQDYLYPD